MLNIQYNLVQNFVQGEPSPSLQCIILGKISSLLWHQTIIHKATENIKELNHFNFQQLEEEIFKKLKLIVFPKQYSEEFRNIVIKIGYEIKTYFASLCCVGLSFNHERVKIYMNSINWTLHWSVNYLKSVSCLIKNSHLMKRERCNLAYNFCLTKNHKFLKHALSRDILFRINTYRRLLMDWSKHIEATNFLFFIRRREAGYKRNNHNLLLWAIINDNEVAVQYIWETMNNLEMREKIVYYIHLAVENYCFAKCKRHYSNILFYMLSQLNRDEYIEGICIIHGYEILLMLDNEDRWHNYFKNVAKYVVQFISKMNFEAAIKTVALCWKKNVVKRGDQIFLKEIALNFNIDIKINFILGSKTILLLLLQIKDVKIHKQLLNIGSLEEGKKFLYDACIGVDEHRELITTSNLDLLDLFIKEMFVSEEEVNDYKNYIFKEINLQVCSFYINIREFKSVDDFLNLYCSKDEITKFKQELPYKKNGEIVSELFAHKKSYSITEGMKNVDEFLIWCFGGNDREIADCKAILCDFQTKEFTFSKKILSEIYYLLNRGEWKLLNLLLEWVLSTEKNIIIFKQYYVSWIISHNDGYYLLKFINELKKFEIFKEFVDYFIADDKLAAFKKELQLFRVQDHFLIGDLLYKNQFGIAEDLIRWFYCSHKLKICSHEDQIDKYKDFVMRVDGSEIFYNLLRRNRCHKQLMALIKWFQPSQLSALSYKEWFLQCFMPTKRKASHLKGKFLRDFRKRVNLYLSLLITYSKKELKNDYANPFEGKAIINDCTNSCEENTVTFYIFSKKELVLQV